MWAEDMEKMGASEFPLWRRRNEKWCLLEAWLRRERGEELVMTTSIQGCQELMTRSLALQLAPISRSLSILLHISASQCPQEPDSLEKLVFYLLLHPLKNLVTWGLPVAAQ